MPPNSLQSPDTSVLLPAVTITKSDDQHAGILACSPDGTCWYWNNIDLSLSNVNQHVDIKLNLLQDDYVSYVECAGVSLTTDSRISNHGKGFDVSLELMNCNDLLGDNSPWVTILERDTGTSIKSGLRSNLDRLR
jgi:hypothetical protein